MAKHPGGRPQYEDGPYRESEIEDLLYDYCDFQSESDLEQSVFANLNEILGDKVKAQRQVNFPPGQPRKRSRFRFDIVAVSPKNHYIIECKAPSYNGVVDLVSGVAQLLMYGMLYEHAHNIKPKLILITSKINQFVTEYMHKHGQGVELIVVGKDYHARMEPGTWLK